MTDGSRVTDLIRKDHAWFRRQFSTLEEAYGDTPKAEGLWADLAARLEVHAAAEEALFYPRLLKDDKDAVDDTKDAIGDHNQIRDAIRKAEASPIGDSGWWAAVKECYNANREHMQEEEDGPLQEFDEAASQDEQAELARAFAGFETEHASARGISTADKDPKRYIEEHQP